MFVDRLEYSNAYTVSSVDEVQFTWLFHWSLFVMVTCRVIVFLPHVACVSGRFSAWGFHPLGCACAVRLSLFWHESVG